MRSENFRSAWAMRVNDEIRNQKSESMTNDEIRRTDQARMTNDEWPNRRACGGLLVSSFVLRHSFEFRVSSFVISPESFFILIIIRVQRVIRVVKEIAQSHRRKLPAQRLLLALGELIQIDRVLAQALRERLL